MSKIYLKEGDEAVLVINGKEITVSKRTISPTDAEEIINESDKIFSNRKSRKASYELYAQDIAKGEWKTNGETIKFGADGALLDGRNRLCAVKIGKKKVDFLSIGNIDRSVVDTIDIGMKRTLEHVLKIQCNSYETGAAAIVKSKISLDTKQMSQGASEAALGISRLEEVREYENNIEKYQEAARYGKDVWTTSHKALVRSEVGAIYMHLTETLKWGEETVKEFFNKLSTPTEKSIFFTTYDKLNNKKVCRGKDRIKEYIICWNSYITGKRTQRCSYKDNDWFILPKSDE